MPFIEPVWPLITVPARDYHMRVPPHYRFYTDSRSHRQRIRKNVFPAAQTHHTGNQVFSVNGHERLVPNFVIYSQDFPVAVETLQLLQSTVEEAYFRFGDIACAKKFSKTSQC